MKLLRKIFVLPVRLLRRLLKLPLGWLRRLSARPTRLLRWIFAWVGTTAFKLTLPFWRLYLRKSRRTRVVVLHDGKLLLVKLWLSDGSWMLPGGGIHKKEDPLDAALRELKEETRLVSFADRLQLLGAAEHQRHKLRYHYACYGLELPSKPAPRVRHRWPEIIEHKWAAADELEKLALGEEVDQALRWMDR